MIKAKVHNKGLKMDSVRETLVCVILDNAQKIKAITAALFYRFLWNTNLCQI